MTDPYDSLFADVPSEDLRRFDAEGVSFSHASGMYIVYVGAQIIGNVWRTGSGKWSANGASEHDTLAEAVTALRTIAGA